MPGLEDLYREIILDHYRNPRNRGELDAPPAHRVEGFNPLCGDEIVVYLAVADGVVQDLKIVPFHYPTCCKRRWSLTLMINAKRLLIASKEH